MRIWFSLAVLFLSIYMVRLLPMLLLRKNITNRWVRSFLFYVPYVTLAVMTFPAIINATDHVLAGTAAFVVGLLLAWFSGDLFIVATGCCVAAYVCGLFL